MFEVVAKSCSKCLLICISLYWLDVSKHFIHSRSTVLQFSDSIHRLFNSYRIRNQNGIKKEFDGEPHQRLGGRYRNYVMCKVQDLDARRACIKNSTSHLIDFLVKSYLNFKENYEDDESAVLEFWDKKLSFSWPVKRIWGHIQVHRLTTALLKASSCSSTFGKRIFSV